VQFIEKDVKIIYSDGKDLICPKCNEVLDYKWLSS
jgi:hypothetical protein